MRAYVGACGQAYLMCYPRHARRRLLHLLAASRPLFVTRVSVGSRISSDEASSSFSARGHACMAVQTEQLERLFQDLANDQVDIQVSVANAYARLKYGDGASLDALEAQSELAMLNDSHGQPVRNLLTGIRRRVWFFVLAVD